MGRAGSANFRVYQGAATFPANTIFAAAATQSGGLQNNPRFYINGVFDSGAPSQPYGGGATGAATLGSANLNIAGRDNGQSALTGSVVISAAWNRALSDAEVKSLSDNPWQIFAPDSKALWTPAAASVSLPTLVQPSSTTSAGAWTATGAASLHEAINELVASDTQYISVNSASSYTFRLAEAAFPGTANQTVAYRAQSVEGSTLTIRLFQGATTIMERTHSLTSTYTLYTQTLTAGEIALITAGPIDGTLTTS